MNAQREKVKNKDRGLQDERYQLEKLILPNIPYLLFVYLFDKVGQAVRLAPGLTCPARCFPLETAFPLPLQNPLPSLAPMDLLTGTFRRGAYPADCLCKRQEREEIPKRYRIRLCPLGNCRRYKPLHRPGISK